MVVEDLGRVGTDGPVAVREPEKLRLPAEAVQYLLALALRTDLGAAWWRGFVCAHGEPSWVVGGQWTFRARDAEVVRALPEE
jgi:hypothetical protein